MVPDPRIEVKKHAGIMGILYTPADDRFQHTEMRPITLQPALEIDIGVLVEPLYG